MSMRPPMPVPTLSRRAKLVLGAVGVLLVLFTAIGTLTNVYVDYLWFDETGYTEVFWTTLQTRALLFAVAGVAVGGLTAPALVPVGEHDRGRLVGGAVAEVPDERQQREVGARLARADEQQRQHRPHAEAPAVVVGVGVTDRRDRRRRARARVGEVEEQRELHGVALAAVLAHEEEGQ